MKEALKGLSKEFLVFLVQLVIHYVVWLVFVFILIKFAGLKVNDETSMDLTAYGAVFMLSMISVLASMIQDLVSRIKVTHIK